MAREKNCFDINNIAYAVFENSGQLSILQKGDISAVNVSDTGMPVTDAALACYLVIDGVISFSTLRNSKKTKHG